MLSRGENPLLTAYWLVKALGCIFVSFSEKAVLWCKYKHVQTHVIQCHC